MKEPKGPPQACLFVASISDETKEETLRELFSDFGEILKVNLLKDRALRPYAFVQFSNIEEAEAALQQTNGMQLEDRRIRVEKAKVNRTIFVAKLPRQMSNYQLREVMEEYGPVESVTIIKNHHTNKSKGCGFVKFVYREDAKEAFAGSSKGKRKWIVEWATSTNDPDLLGVDKYNIFVGGLNSSLVDRDLLEQRFSQYGEIDSITLINRGSEQASSQSVNSSPGSTSDDEKSTTDKSIRSAFAFVRFKDATHAATAIENEDGVEWLDRHIRVQYCESPEMKYKRRANKYYQMNPMEMYYPSMNHMMMPPLMMVGGPVFYGDSLPKYNEQEYQMYSNAYAPYPVYPYSTPYLYPQLPLSETGEPLELDGEVQDDLQQRAVYMW